MSYAPIILFIYNRPDHTEQTLEALARNTLAQESDLFIYADGPKENAATEQREKIRQAREVARSRQWCRSVTVIESDRNRGLAASVIAGVTETVNKYGRVIVLEDDIVTGKYFLEYMNTALERYEKESRVWEVAGFRNPVRVKNPEAAFFAPMESCWGWATWADRWKHFKKDAPYYKSIFTKRMIWEFNREGSQPSIWEQVEMNLSGKMNTWAVFWAATIYLQHGLTLIPHKSLVRNVGFDGSGSNCGSTALFNVKDSLDWRITIFPDSIGTDRKEFNKDKHHFRHITGRLNVIKFFSHAARIVLPRRALLALKGFLVSRNIIEG